MISADRLRQYDQAMRANRAEYRMTLVSMEAQAKIWASLKMSEAEKAATDAIDDAHRGRITGRISINDCEERCRAAIVKAEHA